MTTGGITQNLNQVANGSNTGNSVTENPKGILDKDSFMKLLLIELQYQDPTEPMDSEKILAQTSQLATLESANNTNEAMEKLISQLKGNMDMGSLAAIGKMASLGSNTVPLSESGSIDFEIYFKNEIKDGTLHITDINGNPVRDISLSEQAGKSGNISFEWDGTDNSGDRLPEGLYNIKSEYLDANDEQQKTQFGVYPVESVKYDAGKALMKLGSYYVPMDKIKEFF